MNAAFGNLAGSSSLVSLSTRACGFAGPYTAGVNACIPVWRHALHHDLAHCRCGCVSLQSLHQLQQQHAEATSKLREYAAADGLIERAITSAANAGVQQC
jgi:hypothetical protein